MNSRHSFLGVLLVVIGLALLVSNLGFFHINLFALFRLWPVVLIALGVSVLMGQKFSKLLTFLVVIAILAIGGVGYFVYDGAFVGSGVSSISEHASNTCEEIDYQLNAGGVELEIAAFQSDTDQLIEVDYDGNEPTVTFSGHASKYEVNVKQRKPFIFGSQQQRWNVLLRRDIPISLDIDVAASEATLDLSEVMLKKLDFDGAAGDLEIVLSEQAAERRVRIDVDMAAGSIEFKLPRSAAVLINYDKAIGSQNLSGKGFSRNGNAYYSPLWQSNTAEATVMYEIVVDAAVGQLDVEWYGTK